MENSKVLFLAKNLICCFQHWPLKPDFELASEWYGNVVWFYVNCYFRLRVFLIPTLRWLITSMNSKSRVLCLG